MNIKNIWEWLNNNYDKTSHFVWWCCGTMVLGSFSNKLSTILLIAMFSLILAITKEVSDRITKGQEIVENIKDFTAGFLGTLSAVLILWINL